ncbi:MAG TPA: carbonic anhydrase [Gammaproteobacteria bacterium]|nr:carbonic anhydrase [Gammaproteobacteria bacterium]
MASGIDSLLENNQRYASGDALHEPSHPGKQKIQPAKRLAVVACMDARIDVEDLLGLQTGDAHVIRNAGGVINEDAIRNLVISHHLLDTNEIMLIHHTRCGMLAFTDDLLKAGLEGDPAAEKLLGQATGRKFVSCGKSASTPEAFHAFRGGPHPLNADDEKARERLRWDVRRGISAILNHPWLPTSGPDAIKVRGFVYDVDTGKLEEVGYPGPIGSIG